MTPEKAKRIQQLSTEIASLLYEEREVEEMTSLIKIEHVTPNIGVFLSKRAQIGMEEGQEG
jgi:hypothetical protein